MKNLVQSLSYLFMLVLLFQNVKCNDISYGKKNSTPIVIWHGMGDNSIGLGRYKEILEEHIPGVYVTSLMVGASPLRDSVNGILFFSVEKQIEMVCKTIREDENLQNGFNGIGFSQGGLFLRAIAEVCPQGMKKLITFGSPHQGVYGNYRLYYIGRMLNYFVTVVPLQYWHDPLDEDTYEKSSLFLSDINNAKKVKNETYKDNFTKLQKVVLVKFNQDSMVSPRDTEWFGYYKPGQGKVMIPYNETNLYTEDWIGLRKLDNEGKVDFLSVEGNHLQLTDEFFIHNIIEKYLLD